MLINLTELFTCEGKKKEYTVESTFEKISNGADDFTVIGREPFKLVINSLGGRKYTLKGETTVELEAPCARCLEPVKTSVELLFDREFELNDEGDEGEGLDREPYISGYNLDVDELVFNELMLSLPMKVLCMEDCKGICNRCGTNLNYSTCTCDTGELDPRMSVFQEVFNQFKEV